MKSIYVILPLILCITGCSGGKNSELPVVVSLTFRGEGKNAMSMPGNPEFIESDDHPDKINGVICHRSKNDFIFLQTQRGSNKIEYGTQLIYAFSLSKEDGIIIELENELSEYYFIINGEKRNSIHINSSSGSGYLNIFVTRNQNQN